jgi:AraC-like DNA-binding protein
MNEIYHIETISELNKLLNQEKPKHPLVSIIDFSKVQSFGETDVKITTGFYSIMLKNRHCNKLKYGRENFDFQEGTLTFFSPKRAASIEDDGSDENKEMAGWGLFFHPDLIRRTSLSSKMKDYSFFSYGLNEALHLSDKEKSTLDDCVAKINTEISQNIDNHSQNLIVSNIELLLNYCTRYYDRQFITRKNSNQDTLVKFEKVLSKYFNSDNLKSIGIPTVKYCAEKLCLSPNYLSDLLKKETGKNTQDHIHIYLIEEAKNSLLSTNATVSEIAYQLGFDYPQYFSKLFKSKTGVTPAEYRNLN